MSLHSRAWRGVVCGLGLLLAGTLAGGCASIGGGGGVSADAGVRTVSGDGPLRAEWEVDAPRPERRRISGYIYNPTNYFAGQVRLMVEILDGAGQQVVDRRLQWVAGGVPSNNRAYFEVRDLPPADHYRVSVPYFTWEDSDRGIFRRRF